MLKLMYILGKSSGIGVEKGRFVGGGFPSPKQGAAMKRKAEKSDD